MQANRQDIPVYCDNQHCNNFGVVLNLWDNKHVHSMKQCVQCNKLLWFKDGIPKDEATKKALVEAFRNENTAKGGQQQRLLKEATQIQMVKEPMGFTSNCDISGCPIAPKGSVRVPLELWNSWVYLAKSIDTEWIAYLKGTIEEDKINIAEDGMWFPEQKANGAHVDSGLTTIMQEGTIAAVHSHVKMKAFFSDEDKRHFNHPCEMVVNAQGEAMAMVRHKLECGRYTRVETPIYLIGDERRNALLTELKSKITEDKRVVTVGKEFTEGRGAVREYVIDKDGKWHEKGAQRNPNNLGTSEWEDLRKQMDAQEDDDDMSKHFGEAWSGIEWEDHG